MPEKFIYLICPVNDVTDKEKEFLDNYVSKLESSGYRVHYPPRDVNQEDPIGTRILTAHRTAMHEVTDVHAYLGQKTKGSYFDFGMAYMAEKPVYLVNLEDISARILDSFDQFALGRSENKKFPQTVATFNFKTYAQSRKEEFNKTRLIEYTLNNLDKQFFFDFGMAFYTEKPIILTNREEVEKLRTPKKSFQNVLLKLDSQYRK